MELRPLALLIGFAICCGVPAWLTLAALMMSGRIDRNEK